MTGRTSRGALLVTGLVLAGTVGGCGAAGRLSAQPTTTAPTTVLSPVVPLTIVTEPATTEVPVTEAAVTEAPTTVPGTSPSVDDWAASISQDYGAWAGAVDDLSKASTSGDYARLGAAAGLAADDADVLHAEPPPVSSLGPLWDDTWKMLSQGLREMQVGVETKTAATLATGNADVGTGTKLLSRLTSALAAYPDALSQLTSTPATMP